MEKEQQEDDYLQVIGEAEMPMDEAGYRLNLSYNGPMHIRHKFAAWADSLAKELPGMALINESVYMNYMPEEIGKQKLRPDMFQTSVSYNVTVPDSATYGRIVRDALAHQFPFNLNVSGTFVEEAKRGQLQQELMAQALENAKAKLNSLSGGAGAYKIVGIEELDSNQPYGPEYYDFNRKMVSRVKVKARLNAEED
ncbi:hypothetical protein GCM10007389_37550 [Pontibacter akesuensis]|nr:hypothetical protein GCM10007389_37550 [Pontibacter akesuensis]